jgi:phosphoribosylaminoimidazole (AIR) synthetase
VLKDIQKAWTGHGSATEYKSAIESGFITYVHKPHPGFRQWWRLTEKGARVIQKWHREGHNCGKGFTLITEPNFFDYSKHNPANK